MSDLNINLNDLFRRGNDRFATARRIHEYFQCVIFYGRLVKEELELEIPLPKKIFKKYFNSIDEINKSLENKRFIFPYYSQEIFYTKEDAERFIPLFIQKLIDNDKLPNSIILEDKSVDDTQIQAGVVKLVTVDIEIEDQETTQ